MKLALRVTTSAAFFFLLMTIAFAGMGLVGIDSVGVQIPLKVQR